jgi:hypothetical protein
MKFKTLMVIKAIVCLFFGIAFIFFPSALLSLFGITLGLGGEFTGRIYGASLFGNLLLTWFGRNTKDSDARRAIILALFVYDAIGFIVALITRLTGVLNPLVWLVVAIYLFFTLGFGYFLIVKRSNLQESTSK